ncbi:FAD binding domain-containing protein [Desulfovibrio sp. OttesenSCG-928-G15]|nr:FAD binding domain-containing protein [Desulfovibrio sp. OttesenSCG-928-G15]
MNIAFTVNGTRRSVDTAPLARLLDLLRDDLSLTGCKEGCGEGECGACSVILDGRLVNACMIPAMQAAGSTILTIEGLGENGCPDKLQQAFVEEGGIQCGFCTPGMVLAARTLLQDTPAPSLEETRVALSGNLCRCTGYARIYASVESAVRNGYAPSWQQDTENSFAPVFSDEEKDHFFRPASLGEALEIRAKHPDALLVCGNTDIGPDMKSGKLKPAKAMDIFSLPELKLIEEKDGAIRIGAAVVNTDILGSALIQNRLPALAKASSGCAAPAIRNRATIGGNICTASGAADLPGPLMALGASVELMSAARGARLVALEDFILGYRKVDLAPDELLTAIIVPLPAPGTKQVFYKRGSREALTLSRVSLAIALCFDETRIVTARAAAGSMSPVPRRLPLLEAALVGKTLDKKLIEVAVAAVREDVQPRKSGPYRKAITGNLLRRFLEQCCIAK